MSKPTQAFIWSTTGTKVDPGGTKTGAGFVHGDRFPFQWANFLLHLIEQWITWLYAFLTAVDTRREQPWQALVDVLQDIGETRSITACLATTSCALPEGYDSAYGAPEVLAIAGVDLFSISVDGGISWTDAESGTNTWLAIDSAYKSSGSWAVVGVSASGKVRSATRAGAAAQVNTVQTLSGSPALAWVKYDWYQDMWLAGGTGGVWYAVNPASTWTQFSALSTIESATIVPSGGVFSYWILPRSGGTTRRSFVTSQVPAAVTSLTALDAVGSGGTKVCAYDRLGSRLIISDSANVIWTSADHGDTIATTTTLAASSIVTPVEWRSHALLFFLDPLGAASLRVPHGACVPAQLTATTLASSFFSAIASPFFSLLTRSWGSRVIATASTQFQMSRRPRTPVAAGDIA